jgi:hypothetical protein
MSRGQIAAACVFTIGLTLGAGAASAGSFSIPLGAVAPDGSATASITISLPRVAGGSSGFFFGFVLPQDYETNRKVQIVFYLRTTTTGCNARILATNLNRNRVGLATAIGLTGLTPADGSTTVSFPDNNVVAKIFDLRKGIHPGQRRGDAIVMRLAREGTAADTCADGPVRVVAIDVRYPSVPPAP